MESFFTRRLSQIITLIKGFAYKYKIDLIGLPQLKPLPKTTDKEELIVSLTTFGRRVNNVVYYTLIYLLQQTKQPNRIILWIDEENWNIYNIPTTLKSLKEYGVEIRFCKDIRSYTKLVPTLINFPKSIIITVDDDIIYRKNMISDLYEEHKKFPTDIICNMARFPQFNDTNQIEPYETWFSENHKSKYIMPIGVSGVLYPPNSLYKDVVRCDLFQRLAPLADDLWFWVMGVLNGTKYHVINQDKMPGCNFDGLYQYLHRDASLTHQNREEKKNDQQIKAIIDYYNLDFSNSSTPQ